MRTILIITLCGLAVGSTCAQDKGDPSSHSGPTVQRSSDFRAASTNNVVRSVKHPNVTYSGVVVQAVKSNPLQLINPFAPASAGHSEANTVRDPVTGRAGGVKLIAIGF